MPDPPPHNPTILGEFLIFGVLGEGGSGTVYDARWGHREVALKVLRGDLVDGERDRFLLEARLLVEMTHPGVVKVLAAGALPDGRPFLAMEKLPGDSLAHRLARGPLPLPQAVALFAQLSDAVSAMHARALIHRDLKPENVMLVAGVPGPRRPPADGGEPVHEHAILLDFGIAKLASDGVAAPTQSGLVRGTPAYMAPERFFGHPASVATDVYELAVTFFAMVAGRLPWADSADPEVRLNPARLADVAAVPAALDEVVARALSTRAPNRPASAAAFCQEIVAAAGLGAGPIARHTAPLASHPRRVLAPGLTDAPTERAKVRPPGAATPWDGRGKTTTGAAASGERGGTTASLRRRRWPVALAAAVAVAGGGVVVLVFTRDDPGPAATTAKVLNPDDPWSGSRLFEPLPVATDAAVRTRIEPAARARVRDELAEAFERLPIDGHVVGGLAIAELRETPELARLLAGLDGSAWAGAAAVSLGPCAIELAPRTRWVAFNAVEGEAGFDVVARGDWSRADVDGCLARGSSAGLERRAVRGREGKPLTIVPRLGDDTVIGWLDDHTLVTSSRDGVSPALVAAMLAPPTGAGTRARANQLALTLDRRSTAWLVADHAALTRVTDRPALQHADATLRLGFDDAGGLGLQLSVDFPDHAQAEVGKKALEADLSELTGTLGFDLAFDDFTIRRDGATVRLHTVVPAGLVDKLQDAMLDLARR